jgi:glycosyltransferase involved in cell wall biosynthesis
MTTVTVLIPTYDRNRLPLLRRAVESVLPDADQVVVVVDSNAELLEDLKREFVPFGIDVLASRGVGASNARNTGLAVARGEVVVGLDDDARAERGWHAAMLKAFSNPEIVGAGGRIEPDYERGAKQLPEELLWIIGSTYRGHREEGGPISRPIGAFMAFRRDAIEAVGGFSPEFGPRPEKPEKKSSSNEEIVLAEAIRRKFGPNSIVYIPQARARHFAPAFRTTWSYLLSRSWVEGTSKAGVRAMYGQSVMGDDSRYAWGVLVPAVLRYAGRGRVGSAARCFIAGAATAGGYASSSLARALRRG